MQHRARTPVRGRHRRTDTLPGAPVRPAAPPHPCPAAPAALRACRDLLAAGDKLTPRHRAPDGTLAAEPAPHRRDVRSHRAPGRPAAPALLGERGRYAVAAAVIAAGVGVAGVAAAATTGAGRADAVATTSHTPAAIHTTVTPVPETDTTGTAAARTYAAGRTYTAAVEPTPAAEAAAPALGAVRAARKVRPAPVARWVDPMPGAVTTSCFGPRWGRLHAGVDLASPHGTPIRAVGAGTVVSAGAAEGYGNAVLIDHGNGYLTHYGHMSAIAVTDGQRLTAGEQIGNEGSTGHSTGPHLHFEVHQGTYKNPVEPTAWMHERGVDIGGCGRV